MSEGRLCIECLKVHERVPGVALCQGPSPTSSGTCNRGVCEKHLTVWADGRKLCPVCVGFVRAGESVGPRVDVEPGRLPW